ncbi:MAG: iron ABC transporter permease [Pyrobaculum sp.]
MEAEVAERNRHWVRPYLLPPLFFLIAYATPYALLLANYGVALAVDSYTLWVFGFTVAQALLSAALSLAGGFALLPAYLRLPWARAVALVPFFAPALSTVDALIRLHGDVMYSPWGVVLAHGVYYAPYAALLLEANARSIPADLLDAVDLYARRAAARLRIFMYELRPAVLYSFYTVFVFSFLSFTTPLLLGGRYPTLELLVYIYATSFASSNLVSTTVLLTLAVSLALAIPFFKLPAPPSAEQAPRPPRVGAVALAASAAVLAYYVILSFYLFQPLAQPRGLGELVQPLTTSVLVAVLSATASLMAAISFLVAESAGERHPVAIYIVAISLSKSLFALGFFHLAQPLYGTALILAAAHTLVITPLAYSLVKPAWEKIRQDVREACVLYLGPFKCVSRIATEMLGPTVLQTWLMSLASSLSETTLALILTTGGSETLSAVAVRLLTSRAPDLIETGHFYSALLAAIVLATLAASRLVKTRPFTI